MSSSCGLPGLCNDVVHAPLRFATTSGGAYRGPIPVAGVGSGDATYPTIVGDARVVARWGSARHHLPCPTVHLSTYRGDGGDRCVAHTGTGRHRPGGHLRRPSGLGWSGQRRQAVVMPTRDGPGRGAGVSASRSASSRSHRASSCCRRIHSASTIAAASSSRLVAHWVPVAMSLTPFPDAAPLASAVGWAGVRR
jgi:hypothetical protein